MTIDWEAAGGSDVGRLRRGNEDTLRMDPGRGIFLVADGMGGHAAGEVASDLAATAVEEAMKTAIDAGARGDAVGQTLRDACAGAYAAIVAAGRAAPQTRGMGTTLTACILERNGTAHVAHIGDSRLYLLRDGALQQVTSDHTWVQREIDAGRIAPESAQTHPLSHILTRVLSEDVDPEVDLLSFAVHPGDLLLLASDGLYNMVDDPLIASLLAAGNPLPEITTALINAANDAGGADNITVVLVGVKSGQNYEF